MRVPYRARSMAPINTLDMDSDLYGVSENNKRNSRSKEVDAVGATQ